MKNIFKESYFDEPQYELINKFVAEESANMKIFFREIVTMEDDNDDLKKKFNKRSPRNTHIAVMTSEKSMYSYYKANLNRPALGPVIFNSKNKKQIENMNDIKEFRVKTMVLALEDIKFLAKIIKENEDEIVARGWTDMLRYAKTIKNNEELDSLIQYPYLSDIN